jgi:hypothetical protein
MTIRNQSLLITYIVFVTKLQKRQIPEKSICPIGNSRYEIKAKMLAVSKVFWPVDILTILLQITALPKPEIRE